MQESRQGLTEEIVVEKKISSLLPVRCYHLTAKGADDNIGRELRLTKFN